MIKILACDDDPSTLAAIKRLLPPETEMSAALRGAQALQIARRDPPDIILLDISLPDISGLEALREIKADPLLAQAPVIFLSGVDSAATISAGFELGCADFIAKPIEPLVFQARVGTQIRLAQAGKALLSHNALLEKTVAARTRELSEKALDLQSALSEIENSHDLAIAAMGQIVETRDNDTGGHIMRTRLYTRELVNALRGTLASQAPFPGYWDMIWKSSPLHDIGKVGIADSILQKPGKLTAEEYKAITAHALIGAQSIEKACAQFGKSGQFLHIAKEIALYHHEKYDGTGYPFGLSGENIPLSARIMALADVYDALTTERPYKKAWTHPQACRYISEQSGLHFDPAVAAAFASIQDVFQSIAREHNDPPQGKIS